MGGVRLVKTYTLKRGAYVVDVRHEVINAGGQAVNPQLYVQLVRDGNKPAGESSFYSTFTGPAFYTEAKKFQKVDFSDIEKGKADFVTASPDGWVAMVQHYFAGRRHHRHRAHQARRDRQGRHRRRRPARSGCAGQARRARRGSRRPGAVRARGVRRRPVGLGRRRRGRREGAGGGAAGQAVPVRRDPPVGTGREGVDPRRHQHHTDRAHPPA